MDKLNKKQLQNLNLIMAFWDKNFPPKYILGAIEHDSTLSDFDASTLVGYALEEVLDLMSYLVTAKQAIDELETEVVELRAEIKKKDERW